MKCKDCSEEMECVVDFCGYTARGHHPSSFWSVWCPKCKVTKFGGDWMEIPDMPSDTCPDDDTVSAVAQEFMDKLK